MRQRLPKFKRAPEAYPGRHLTATSLAILDLLARYHVLPTSLLVRLAPSSKNITHRHLQLLFHRELVNRFSFPRVGNPGEFHYYLDNSAALVLLDRKTDQSLAAIVKRNREKRYADVHDLSRVENMQGKLLFLKHEVMISRFHAMLELACRASEGTVQLERFAQGPSLWRAVGVPATVRDSEHGDWIEIDTTERKALRPDAFFTLKFPAEAKGNDRAHFFYEADRETESTQRIAEKLRVYFHYVVRQRQHQTHFGIKRVRAVLFETLSPEWSKQVTEVARQPIVSGGTPSILFWFTASAQLSDISRPACMFDRVWSTAADRERHSLLD